MDKDRRLIEDGAVAIKDGKIAMVGKRAAVTYHLTAKQTINAAECDVVVTGTPIDLGRLIHSRHPIRHVTYELHELGEPSLESVLAPIIASVKGQLVTA